MDFVFIQNCSGKSLANPHSKDPDQATQSLSQLSKRAKEIMNQTVEEHKEFQVTLNRYGKVIDKVSLSLR